MGLGHRGHAFRSVRAIAPLALALTLASGMTGCASSGEESGASAAIEYPGGAGSFRNPARDWSAKPPPLQLVFDVNTGLYRLVSYPGHYFDGERFYRRIGERWQASERLESGWGFVGLDSLPAGLAAPLAPNPELPVLPASPAD